MPSFARNLPFCKPKILPKAQDDGIAEVAELADALASGASDRKIIRVQLPSSAPLRSFRATPGIHKADNNEKYLDMEAQRTYSIEKFSKNWARRFRTQEKLLRNILGKNIVHIHHVGSTSIPGMSAKPIVDVLAIVKNLKAIDRLEKKFNALGYSLRFNYVVPHSRFLEKFRGTKKLYNIHLLPEFHGKSRRLLRVKNYLIAHPSEAEKYADLKKKLYKKTADYALYRKGKTNYLNALEKRADVWAKNNK